MIIILTALSGIALGLLYNLLVIRHYPEAKRKGSYVGSVFLFFFVTVFIAGSWFGRIKIDETLKDYSNQLEQYVASNFSDLDLVRNGLDVVAIQNDVTKLNTAFGDLDKVLGPYAGELGVPDILYNIGSGALQKEIDKRLLIVNNASKGISTFANDSNFITVASLLNYLRVQIMKIVTIIAIVITVLFGLIFINFFIRSLITVSNEKNKKAAPPPQQPQPQLADA